WTAAEAVAATNGKSTRDWSARGVSIDSRTVAPGDLFIALAGPKFDGHDFVAMALERGAVAALVSRVPTGIAPDAPLLLVPTPWRRLRTWVAPRAGAARRGSSVSPAVSARPAPRR